MGTILNTCKEARAKIRIVDEKMDQAVVCWKILNDGNRQVEVYLSDESKKIRDDVLILKGYLETIAIELEKDSEVRPYYNTVYNRCINFLQSTKEKEERI